MPRGVKKQINYQEEIERIDMRITHYQNSIKELEEKKELYINKKNENDINVLISFLSEQKLSAEDLINQLNLIQQTA